MGSVSYTVDIWSSIALLWRESQPTFVFLKRSVIKEPAMDLDLDTKIRVLVA
jgi:hypothetical protein